MEILIDGKNAFECNREMIHEAFETLRKASKRLEQRTANKFYEGQYVSFTSSKRGIKIIGKILSINKTTISLVEVSNPRSKWRVSPSMLSLYNGEKE